MLSVRYSFIELPENETGIDCRYILVDEETALNSGEDKTKLIINYQEHPMVKKTETKRK